jgi:hypothetical protein
MSNMDGLALFATGVRVSVMVMMIVVLWRSIKGVGDSAENVYASIARNPKVVLTLVVVLLALSLFQAFIQLYDNWSR